MSLATTKHEADTLRRAAIERGLRGEVLLINDAAALLFAPPLHSFGIVVSVGTGTAFWCRNRDGQVYAASGHEYILSDEGGGFDIGRKGLQAAARAYDGRAEQTLLLDAAVERYGENIPALGRHLATSVALKREVGAFAVNVCQLAPIDPIADAILERACRSVLLGFRAMLRHARDSVCPVVLTGSLLTQQSRFRDLAWAALADECRSCHLYEVPCAATSALWLAEHLADVRDALTAPIAAEVVVL
jgi:N-acetylglucosamine kinase-like BadF-type ATPase